MSTRSPRDAQDWLHRYVAVLFAVSFPSLAVVEIARIDMAPHESIIRWATYLVLAVWALYLTQRPQPNTMALVVTTMGFFGSLSVIEALFGVEISAFDFATIFGLIMMLGVLAGTLAAGSRLVWAGGIAFSVAIWSVTMGVLFSDGAEVMAVRAAIASAGVLFTTALVSRLFDQLSEAIETAERSTRLQEAIARCSEALLVQTDTFAIYEAVKALLEASEADYAFVDRLVEIVDEPGWDLVAEASRRSDGPGSSRPSGKYSSIPSKATPLFAGNAVVLHTTDLKDDERQIYLDAGVLSDVSIPIFVDDEFRGSIGFVQFTEDRRWSDNEIQTLWRASHMIGAYWARQADAAELVASSESKERLLASVSHEIRTPLTAIVGLSEEIISSRTSLGEEELDELNGIIAVQSRELAELVEDLLVASRADFGNISIRPEQISLRRQAEMVVQGVRESLPTDQVLTTLAGDVDAWADPLRVRQIMRNLLTNAIKYGGPRVVIGVREHDGLAQVVVADDGQGVPSHESDLIFERYYRSSNSATQPGSVGIGLAVSRQLAEMMDGNLVYINGENQHRFEMSLPLALTTAPNGSPLSEADDVGTPQPIG